MKKLNFRLKWIQMYFSHYIQFGLYYKSIAYSMSNNRHNPFNDYEYMGSGRQGQPQQPSKIPIDSYYFSTQNPKNKKEYGMYSRRYLPQQNLSNVSRSRVTQYQNNMSTSYNTGFLPQEKLYSEQMLFLLSEQENNLKYFKEKIEGEKQRVIRDFNNVKKQIQHILQDLQISFIAELDIVYKDFINRYKTFKQHMVNLKEIRRNLMNEVPTAQNDYLTQLNQSKTNTISNRDLLNQIEKDAQLFRTQKIYSQITDMQRQNIQPAKELSNEIVVLGGIETQFYNEGDTNEMMRNILDVLNKEIKSIYTEIHNHLIYSADHIIAELNPNKNDPILNGLSQYEEMQERNNFKSADHKDIFKVFPMNTSTRKQEFKMQEQPKKYVRPVSSSTDFHPITTISKQNKAVRDDDWQDRRKNDSKKSRNYHMGNLKNQANSGFKVGLQQQNILSQWIEDINLREVAVIDAHQNSEAMLCGVFACEGKAIVVGGKDKVLRVYQVATGKLLYVLSGHQANICSMASHGQFISSGGDHGCSSLIVWDCKSWSIRSKVQLHSAAVTCIIDLQDSTNLASASYDRKINIFSYRKGSVIFTVNSCKAGIACMGLTSDKHRMISSSLDNSIAVWKITREGTNITNLELQRQFMNDFLVCSLRPFALKSNYFMVGTKEGKIQIINCLTGETIRKIAVGTSPVVEMVLFQRENKNDSPITLSCLAKQKSLMITKTETGVNSMIDVKGRLNVQIGCGIGPKLVVSDTGLMSIISQSPMLKQILLYQIALL